MKTWLLYVVQVAYISVWVEDRLTEQNWWLNNQDNSDDDHNAKGDFQSRQLGLEKEVTEKVWEDGSGGTNDDEISHGNEQNRAVDRSVSNSTTDSITQTSQLLCCRLGPELQLLFVWPCPPLTNQDQGSKQWDLEQSFEQDDVCWSRLCCLFFLSFYRWL